MECLSSRFPDAEFYGCCISPNEPPNGGPVHAFPLNRDVPSPWKTGSPAPVEKRKVEYAPKSHAVRDWAKRMPLLADLWRRAGTFWSTLKKGREELAFCFEAYRFVREFRLLAIGLGGVFDEVWGGKWGDLYSYFRWAILARLARTPLVCLSVGVEEINTRLAKFFFRTALSLAAYRSFRDVESKEKAETLGVGGEKHVFPDLAFALNLGSYDEIVADRREPKLVGISPMAYCDPRFWPIKDLSAYHNYLNSLSSFMSWLLQEGYDVVLFPTQVRMDRLAIEELKALVLEKLPPHLHARLSDVKLQTVEECLALVSRLEIVVTSRLHGVILASLVNTPIIAISPASKVDRLMEDMEMTKYLLNIRQIELPLLINCFLSLKANQTIIRQTMKQNVAKYRLAIMSQFDFVFRSSLRDL
jgi:polysaccharide pyruvyl transferase WcaK-like protein